jgi:flagellar assembly factor FliW
VIAVDSTTKSTILQTERWGRLEIDEDEIIHFQRGIPGFDHLRKFAIFNSDDLSPFQWLISLEELDFGFVIIPPHVFCPDYQPKLFETDLIELDVDPSDKLALFVIVTLGSNPTKATANLQGPLLMNLNKKTGKQIVVVDEKYSTKYPILNKDDAGEYDRN